MSDAEIAHAEAVLELGAYTLRREPEPAYVLQELVTVVAQLLAEVRRLRQERAATERWPRLLPEDSE